TVCKLLKISGRACKPDSVLRQRRSDDHSSRSRIAPRLQQPTRGLLSAVASATAKEANKLTCSARRAGPALPSYLALHHAGVSVPRPSPDERWALTPPFHPYQQKRLFRR